MDKIHSYTVEEYCNIVRSFHGSRAPGVVVGGFMVDLAYDNFPPDTIFDVICETSRCLPDAVQLITPCTTGNRWLKVIDTGRFALTFYNKYTGDGVRVYLDYGKLEPWPQIKEWFLKLKPKKEQDDQLLFAQIRDAGTRICSINRITVAPEFLEKSIKAIAICPSCNEAYRTGDGPICTACHDGSLPYVSQHSYYKEKIVG